MLNTIVQHTQQLITASTNQPQPTIVLGLSGGPDSVFLFHVLEELHRNNSIKLVVAHLDHGWRETSAQDALFCTKLCLRHDIACFVARPDGTITHNTGSLEDFGRRLRRAHFHTILNQTNASLIALAHHLDDQEETFFIRLMRGTTLAGLTGMREHDGLYLRPLLTIRKQEIVHYLDEHKIAYCTDSTNSSDNFLRNRLRNHVIPALRQSDQRFDQKFQTTLGMLKEEEIFLQKLAEQTFNELFNQNEKISALTVQCQQLLAHNPVITRRIIMQWLIREHVAFTPSSSLINEILRFLSSPRGGTHHISPTSKVCKQRGVAWIEHHPLQQNSAV